MTSAPIPVGLFAGGYASIAGLPASFDIRMQLRDAKCIRIATAFAHKSGWSLLEPHLKSAPDVRLLTGLDFCQTEPWVLKKWLSLAATSRVSAYLARCPGVIFHPKVMIVQRRSSAFVLVGSGNLSAGGLRNNFECGMFSKDRSMVRQLSKWFDHICEHYAQPLRQADIETYEPKFAKASARIRAVRKLQQKAEERIVAEYAANMRQWNRAVLAAKRYFSSAAFDTDWKEYRSAMRAIRSLLHFPRFDFNQSEWNQFYQILALGHLIEINRNSVWHRSQRLKSGLRQLLNENVPVADRLDRVLQRGSLNVPGAGLNLFTKVLLVSAPHQWPVYNRPVAEAVKDFGYEPPRGVSAGHKYEAFARLMREFMKVTGASHMAMLDAFFFHHYDTKLRS
jgi:HKD family nuclease